MATNEKRTLNIKAGETTLFNGFEYYNTLNVETEYITSLEGWDEFSAIEINTEPKLIGSGSYVVSERIGERELNIEINVLSEDDVKTYLNKVKTKMFVFADIELTRTYFSADVETRKEQITGKISTVSWVRLDDHAIITITVKCRNPEFKIWVNGSTEYELGL